MADHQSDLNPKPAAIRFPMVDVTGKSLRDPSLWGSLGFRDFYDGSFNESDLLIQAIRSVHRDDPISDTQSQVLRSFCIAWLTSSQKRLSEVVHFAIPLADSVQYITRIGLVDRTVKKITVGTAGIAASILFLEMAWESAAVDFSEMNPLESGIFLMQQIGMESELNSRLDEIYKILDQRIGQPGEAVQRSAFRPEIIFDFLKLCRFRSVLAHANFDLNVQLKLMRRMDERIFALFLANSRQIEGLTICGAAEATAAVVAHAAIALGLHDLGLHDLGLHDLGLRDDGDSATVLEQIRQRISLLDDPIRQSEASQTFDAIQRNLTGKAQQLERRLNRHLHSSTTTEAIDWATLPLTSSFDLLGTIADGLGQVAGTSKVGGFLKMAGEGFNQISSLVDATPDAASHVINTGVSAEQWARNLVGKLWEK